MTYNAIDIYSVFIHVFNCGFVEIKLFVFITDLSMESYCTDYLSIYWNTFKVFLWNLSVHVFIKLILLKLIYFDRGACYIGKINLYMYMIISSFVFDLIVKAVTFAGAACSSLLS